MDPPLEALVERVRAAAASGARLRIRGAGTKDFLGGALEGEILDTRPLAGVVDYEPSELVVIAHAGTPLAELERVLGERGQCLPFEPPRFGEGATLGGAIAAGLSGPRRASVGAARDFVLGLRLLTGRGEVLSFGGRVMKNVAGFDVARLVCGSFGVLGVVVEASVKLLPRPECEQTRVFELPPDEALAAFHRWSRQPLSVSATAWLGGRAHVRLSGAAPAVAAAGRALGGALLEGADADRFWTGLRDHTHPLFDGRPPLWRLSLPSTAVIAELPAPLLIEWAGALRWLPAAVAPAGVAALARRAGGSATLWYGRSLGVPPEPLPPPVLAIHRRLKAAFDPHGVFNRGRLVPEF